MKRHILILVTALSIVVACNTEKAVAQFYSPAQPLPQGPYSTPPLSPYLNLLNRGNPAVNYYNFVIPAFQRRAAYGQFSSAILDLESRYATPAATGEEELVPTLPETGHPAVFMSFGQYFTSNNAIRNNAASPALPSKLPGAR